MKKTFIHLVSLKNFTRLMLLVLCSAPLFVFAANDTFIPLTNLPGLSSTTDSYVGGAPDLTALLRNIYRLCIGASATIAVLQIMRGGFVMMTNKESALSNTEAKGYISNAILGLLLVLSPYIVFSVINPDILNLDFRKSLEQLKPAETSTTVKTSETTTVRTDTTTTTKKPATSAKQEPPTKVPF